jgi:hypothetical protein
MRLHKHFVLFCPAAKRASSLMLLMLLSVTLSCSGEVPARPDFKTGNPTWGTRPRAFPRVSPPCPPIATEIEGSGIAFTGILPVKQGTVTGGSK